jgi:hypothetical protein
MSGLIRDGQEAITTVEGEKLRPDQGCFDALCHRYAMMKRPEVAEEEKDRAEKEFDKNFRLVALQELEEFGKQYGKTLEDVYDVVTYKMFCDMQQKIGKKTEKWFLNNRLWKGYWTIFGGMAERAAMRYEI